MQSFFTCQTRDLLIFVCLYFDFSFQYAEFMATTHLLFFFSFFAIFLAAGGVVVGSMETIICAEGFFSINRLSCCCISEFLLGIDSLLQH